MNLMENTIIIFSSDNGGEIPGNREDAPEIQAIKYGLKINGDLRGDKHTIYEGGTNVPFIVSWPGKVAEDSKSNAMINLIDIFATVADITEGDLPKSKDIAPDSFSFLPSLLGKENPNPRTIMVTADAKGMHAIRKGDWKFIDNTPPDNFPKKRMNQYKGIKPQLYNLANDPDENEDKSDEKPEIAKQMLDELNRIREAGSTR
jgi:arylsulfatase A-like enzyme